MKLINISLITALTVSTMVAGGDIEKVETEVVEIEKVVEVSKTTVGGNLKVYNYTNDSVDFFDKESTSTATAVTLDVSHEIMSGVTANFTVLGYTDLGDNAGLIKMEGQSTGAFFNVANLTANYGDTTFVGGRQTLDTPMIGSFDWLLAPSGFEAYTLVNKSVNNLTLVASFVDKLRANNSGEEFAKLDGDNFTFGATYSDAFSASLWYYNVDAGNYTEVYADAGYDYSGVKVEGQVIATDYDDEGEDSTVYGLKISGSFSNVNLSAAYASVSDREAGMVEVDGIYTSSWNTFASQIVTDSYKLEAGTDFSGFTATASYADYDTANELDLILAYEFNEAFSLDAIYTSTEYDTTTDDGAEGALELIATYKF
jgi:hypothetical protein